jgi:type I restriction enzyme S subunit
MLSSHHQQYLHQLPHDWGQVSIQELGTICTGGTPSRAVPYYWNGSIAWVTPGELTTIDGKWLTETREYITEAGLASSAAKLMPKGALLVTTRASIGAVAVATLPVCTNQGFKSIIPNQLTCSDFYYHLLQLISPEMVRLASGTTFLEISRKDFSAILLPRPPLPEQRRIAEMLDTVDAAIQQTEALIAKLKLMKAGLLHDLLTLGLDEHGQLRDPIAHPEQFKDSPLGRIPREWDVKPVGEVFDMQLGKMLSKAAKTGHNPFPYLANRNVQWDYVDLTDLEWMDFNEAEREKFSLLPDDLLVCEGGDVGRTAMWRGEQQECFFQKAIHRLRPKDSSLVLPSYMLRFMRFAVYHGFLVSLSSQTSITHLTREKFALLPLPLPQMQEQKAIAAALDAHDARIRAEEAYGDKLKHLKKGLMRDLLTGRVRVQAAEAAQ